MSIEVRTCVKINRKKQAVVVLDCLFLPRGSGNRYKAKRLAQQLREHDPMSKHINKITCGSSRVTVEFLPSLNLVSDWLDLIEEEKRKDVPGQLPLFA